MICNQQNSTEHHIILRTCVWFSLLGGKTSISDRILANFLLNFSPRKDWLCQTVVWSYLRFLFFIFILACQSNAQYMEKTVYEQNESLQGV